MFLDKVRANILLMKNQRNAQYMRFNL